MEARLQRGALIGGKYRVDGVVGEGGMGVVYAATHVETSKRVALKWMLPRVASDPRASARLLREAKAAGQIDHPSVVDVYDVGREDGVPFLVMELLRGEPLTVLVGARPVPADTVVEILMPALRGVAAAHALGVVHRDLKPENIFLCQDEDGLITGAKVLDFGISKPRGEDDVRLTGAGSVLGTPRYMAPEQLRDPRAADARTDVYALGVILYEALTGRPPFTAQSAAALGAEIATATPPPPRALVPSLDAALEAVVLRAMAREPAERFGGVAELARALEPFGRGARFDAAGLTPPASRGRPPLRSDQSTAGGSAASPAARPRRWPWALAVVAALIALASVLAARRGEDAPPVTPLPAAGERAAASAAPRAPEAAQPAAPAGAERVARAAHTRPAAASAPASLSARTDPVAAPAPGPAGTPPRRAPRRGPRARAPAAEAPAPPAAPRRAAPGVRTSGIATDEF